MTTTFPFLRGQLIVPPVRIGHEYEYDPVMALDTGAQMTIITPELALEIGLVINQLAAPTEIHGVAGSSKATRVVLNKVFLADFFIENVEALCYQLPSYFQLDGILGLNFLQHFNLAIDHDAETISAKPATWSAP